MIKKLRVKMVIATMLSLLVVLSVIIGSVGILNYREIVSNADMTLGILEENDGRFPDSAFAKGSFQKRDHRLSPELPYESRYFTVFFTSEGTLVSINTGKIAAIDTSTAIDYAETVRKQGKEKGFENDYRYIVYETGTETHLIFLDCGRDLKSFRIFILNSVAVSVVGLLAVLCLLIIVSGRIVKPFSESYEKQKRFITDAGHELKTPLTIINADAEVLEMDYGENEWLDDIRNQTGRLTELTNSLILLSRMEEENASLEMMDFPLSDVVEETVEEFFSLAKMQNKLLTTTIQPMISMYGDEISLRRLLSILLDNALKYSDEGGKISLTLEKKKNCIQLFVFNTAEYISRENLKYLFDRFYRTDQSRNSQTGGYGLGLSIALAIVNTHKGKISASTSDEHSLLIKVIFPQ